MILGEGECICVHCVFHLMDSDISIYCKMVFEF